MRSRQILPAMKRGQGATCERAKKRELEKIDVKMNDVEFVRALAHLIDHKHEVRNGIAHRIIESERVITTGGQFGGSN